MKKTNREGISLIVLVITIIVMLILASAVILKLKDSNIPDNAKEVTFKSDVSGLKDELLAYVINAEAHGTEKDEINYSGEEIKNVITSINEKYIRILEVENGELKYVGENEYEKKWAEEIGVLTNDLGEATTVENTRNINISENYRSLKIYGNSSKDETTSKIQDLGDYIEDTSDINYGKYKISINILREISSENLFNYTEPVDFSYGSITSAIADENGWFDITMDNTNGQNIMYKNCWTEPNMTLKTNTKYYLYVEVEEKSGALEMICASDQAANPSQFTSKMVWGKGIITTKSDFSSAKSMLRTYVTCPAGKQCHIKFRIAVYESEGNQNDSNYTFEPYYGKNINVYLNSPLRKLNSDADYIDLNNKEVVRNIGVVNSDSITNIEKDYYKLSTPVKEKINEMPKLELYKGINRILIGTKLVPSKITVFSKQAE